MAIDIRKGSHSTSYPTKIASMLGQYSHVYNIVLTKNVDNGMLAGRGDYVHYDQYEQDDVPSSGEGLSAVTFGGKIRELASDGRYEVEVTSLPAGVEVLYLYNSPLSPYPTLELQDESLYYNEAGEVVQGAVLCIGDVFNLSTDWFTGADPEAGKSVTFNGTKYVVA